MTASPQRFPLVWPAHRPRTDSWRRRQGKFSAAGRPISMAQAVQRLDTELERLRAIYPLLSTNIALRLDGVPRSNQSAPADPGVCVYFTLKGKPFALACDSYTKVEQNVAALAAHLDATRAIERHGVATAAESLEAFSALPPPTAGASHPAMARGWREILGFAPNFPTGYDPADALTLIGVRYRERAGRAHPDNGGSDAVMAELNAARDAARKEVQA